MNAAPMPSTEIPPEARRRRHAFRLILALGIAGLLVVMGVYWIGTISCISMESRNARVDADVKMLVLALRSYEADNGIYPSTSQGLAALSTKPVTAPVPPRWRKALDGTLSDPWRNPYRYTYPAERSTRDPFDAWSAGPDMTDGTADDIGNW